MKEGYARSVVTLGAKREHLEAIGSLTVRDRLRLDGFGRSEVTSAKIRQYSLTPVVPDFVVPKITNPEIDSYINGARNYLVALGDDVWNQARELIISGNHQNLDAHSVAESINAHVDEIAGPRAGVIARTELTKAMSAGSLMQMKQIDAPSMTKTWITDRESLCKD